jgi:hypothetical protein
VASFFEGKGLVVIKSELIWIGIPTLLLLAWGEVWKKLR